MHPDRNWASWETPRFDLDIGMHEASHLFVYGSLRKALGHPMHRVLERGAVFIGMGSFCGQLYDLGRYPGAIPSKKAEDRVIGEVYRLGEPAKVLKPLDQYEGRRFKRALVTIAVANGKTLPCWIYLYTRSVSGRTFIASGDYVEYQRRT